MMLSSGSRLGPYEVLAPLGAGGMGEVFRARDTRLGREVAIKALPEAFARDAERLARLEREARLLASLSHPNIAGIHGLEIVDDHRYLVLELVEGETLAARLARGALPPADAVDVCRQIAAGLEAAHESGVIHRDLKPGNVMLTPAGQVKLLDFGLARGPTPGAAPDGDLSASPTVTWAATSAGVILGTAAYMSPEQARGKAFDRRTDIWSFGCVLYECLAGRRAFEGETVSDLIAKILEREPDMNALPASTPPRLRALIERCLRKDARARLRDIGDARLELEEIAAGAPPPGAAAPGRRLSSGAQIGLAIAAVILAALAGAGAERLLERRGPERPMHVDIALPDSLSLYGWGSPVIAFSPDGRVLACAAVGPDRVSRVYLHDLGDGRTRLVPGSDEAEGPFFSPDGEWVAFAVSTSAGRGKPELRKHSLRTGLTQTVCAVGDYFGGFWEGDEIVWADQLPGPLMRVPAAGGTARPLLETLRGDTIRAAAWPEPLPGGPWLVVTSWDEPVPALYVIHRTSGECRALGIRAGFARYVPGGLLYYVTQSGQAFVAPFDPKRGAITGEAVAVRDGVTLSGNEAAVFAVAGGTGVAWSEGSLRYSGVESMRLVRKGPGRAPGPLPFEPFRSRFLRVSRDGTRAIVSDALDGPWLVDLARGTRSRLVAAGALDFLPVWNHDGSKVLVMEVGATLRLLEVDAHPGATPRQIGEFFDETTVTDVTPDGSAYLSAAAHSGLLRLHPFDGSAPREALPGRSAFQPRLSPDGRWVAYASVLAGQREVFVERLGGGPRVQVSFGGGALPVWSRDGAEIYFTRDALLFAAPFAPGDPPAVGDAAIIDRDPDARSYDALPGRRELLVLQREPGAGYIRRVRLALGGVQELKELVKARRR